MKGENTNTHQPISACDLLYGNHFLVELHWKMKDMFKMGYLGGGRKFLNPMFRVIHTSIYWNYLLQFVLFIRPDRLSVTQVRESNPDKRV